MVRFSQSEYITKGHDMKEEDYTYIIREINKQRNKAESSMQVCNKLIAENHTKNEMHVAYHSQLLTLRNEVEELQKQHSKDDFKSQLGGVDYLYNKALKYLNEMMNFELARESQGHQEGKLIAEGINTAKKELNRAHRECHEITKTPTE